MEQKFCSIKKYLWLAVLAWNAIWKNLNFIVTNIAMVLYTDVLYAISTMQINKVFLKVPIKGQFANILDMNYQ